MLPLGRLAAQQADRLPKVAILAPSPAASVQTPGSTLHGLLAGLTELGYVDGRNVSFEFRFAENALERLPGLAAELVASQPDVLYTWTSGGARAAAGATSTIPILAAPVHPATMAALTTDFAHPVGNVTGLTYTGPEEHEACLRLLKEAAPGVTRVGVLFNPLNPAWRTYPDVLSEAARALGVELVRAEARGAPEVEQAFAAMATRNVDGFFGLSESTLVGDPPTLGRISELLVSRRLPSVSDDGDFVVGGGLLSFHPNDPAIFRGAADYVHRILRGTKPGELPVMRPKMLLGVNLKTAQALGFTIPQSILTRADEVIR
jgi:putative ABC transport system substrate-binding protein